MHASLLAVLASSGEGPLVPHELRAADGYTNVMGTALVDCSSSNESLTGWTRNGQCVDAGADDEGSHHICVQMTSDFCVTTGQPDWCNQPGDDGKPIGHWCICQWVRSRPEHCSRLGSSHSRGCRMELAGVCRVPREEELVRG